MENQLVIENRIELNAPKSVVWEALVRPEHTKKYLFGCEPVSDWQVGSPLRWTGIFDGHEVVAVKGNVVQIEPETYLAYTTLDPNSGIADIPENYLTVTYHLATLQDKTVLTITQGDYSTVADGEKRYQDTIRDGGWSSVLNSIKAIVEAP